MDAILANIFLAVQERIKSEVPEIRFIDQDMGQLEFYQDRPPVVFPAVLLDIVNINYTNNSRNSQVATAALEVRLAVAAYTQATNYRSELHKEHALTYYNIEHRINKILHGWSDSRYFAPLGRVSSQTEKREDNLRVRPMRYEFAFTDDTAMAVPAQTIPRPDLEVDTQE